jgi:hypothetical protein
MRSVSIVGEGITEIILEQPLRMAIR